METEKLVKCGGGDCFVKLGFMNIKVYAFTFFADAEGLKEKLAGKYAGCSHQQLQQNEGFYNSLIAEQFAKRLCMTFVRDAGKDKLIPVFIKSLAKRCDPELKPRIKEIVVQWIQRDMKDKDLLEIALGEDGQTTIGLVDGAEQMRVQEPQIWKAFQGMFFDKDTEVMEIKHGSVKNIPDILGKPESVVEDADDDDYNEAVEEAHDKGYKFGDFTRSIVKKVFSSEEEHDKKKSKKKQRQQQQQQNINGIPIDTQKLVERIEALESALQKQETILGEAYLVSAFLTMSAILLLLTVTPEIVFSTFVYVSWMALSFFTLELYKGEESRLKVWLHFGKIHAAFHKTTTNS